VFFEDKEIVIVAGDSDGEIAVDQVGGFAEEGESAVGEGFEERGAIPFSDADGGGVERESDDGEIVGGEEFEAGEVCGSELELGRRGHDEERYGVECQASRVERKENAECWELSVEQKAISDSKFKISDSRSETRQKRKNENLHCTGTESAERLGRPAVICGGGWD
jgi:hypothetical protein